MRSFAYPIDHRQALLETFFEAAQTTEREIKAAQIYKNTRMHLKVAKAMWQAFRIVVK